MANYMTYKEICPILLRAMADGKVYARKDLKQIPEQTPGYDHEPGRHGKDSMTSYRAGWSLTLMNNAGLVENVGHGLWKISETARQLTSERIQALLEETAMKMQGEATKKSKQSRKTWTREESYVKDFPLPVEHELLAMDHVRSLLNLLKAGLLSQEAALSGIEKAALRS